MKIVQLITALQLGGAENVAIDISKNLDKNKFDTTLVTIFKDDSKFSNEIKKQLLENDIKWKEFGIRKKFRKLKYIGMLISIIQIFFFMLKYKPDIIHSHTDLPDFVLSNILRVYTIFKMKKPKIVRTIHNTQLWPLHKKAACYVEKMFHNDFVAFISNGARDAYYQLRKECTLPISKNTFFISNGVDLFKYTGECHENTLEKYNIVLSKEKINFLFVGRFVEQKGFDLMIRALNKLEPRLLEKIDIFAFGEGELEQILLEPAYSGLPIKIFAPTTDINLLYGCFDYLIMPSRFEGLGLVALESSASRLPVIASSVPGLSEAIPKNWPLIFESENIDSLRDMIIDVIEKQFDNESLKEIALAFVKNNFNLETTVHSYEKVYKEVINEA